MKLYMAPTKIVPLLNKYDISWEIFSKKGRPPKGVREKRQAIITELHLTGMPWSEMMKITGLSLAGIQRLTKASWNTASLANRVASATRVGHSRKGEKKPWLSKLLEESWSTGKFDFHIGRTYSEEEREKIRVAHSRPDVKAKTRAAGKRRWQRPEERAHLLAFHQSDAERTRRSQMQTSRILAYPEKYGRGLGAITRSIKGDRASFWTRSSYERVVVGLLDSDPTVIKYTYEPRIELRNGRWIVPDFLVTYADGREVLVEVKASWVLNLPPDHKVSRRLEQSAAYARSMGWGFQILTERDFNNANRRTA